MGGVEKSRSGEGGGTRGGVWAPRLECSRERAPSGSQDTHFQSEAGVRMLKGGKGLDEFQEAAATAEDPPPPDSGTGVTAPPSRQSSLAFWDDGFRPPAPTRSRVHMSSLYEWWEIPFFGLAGGLQFLLSLK